MNWKPRVFLPLLLGMAMVAVALPLGGSAYAASSVAANSHPPAALGAAALPLAGGAHTGPSLAFRPEGPCGGCSGYWYTTNQYVGGYELDNLITLRLAPGTGGSISKSVSFSNSWGASSGVSYQAVQAGLSFNISESWSFTMTCSATNTTNHDIYLFYDAYFDTWYYKTWWHNGSNGTNTFMGWGWAENYQYDYCDRTY